MVLKIINTLRKMLEEIAPKAVFECDAMPMLNIKVDTLPRFETDADGGQVPARFIYIEEPGYSYYLVPSGNLQAQKVPLVIYFCTFEPMQNDAYKGGTEFSRESPTVPRLALKDAIEEEMVRPFLARLRYSKLLAPYPGTLESVRIIYPEPRFDANEVSVGVELTITEHWCLDAYRRPWKWLDL